MSCETIKVRAQDDYMHGNPEGMYHADSGRERKSFILGLRLYLDGVYPDPPGYHHTRPRPQQDQYEDCCVIL